MSTNAINMVRDDLRALTDTLLAIESGRQNNLKIPIISLEGVAGAGKTTQLTLIGKWLEENIGNIHFVELPSKHRVGETLSAMYTVPKVWADNLNSAPWLNPLLISVNLLVEYQEAEKKGAKVILMSRGLVSTYYYTFQNLLSANYSIDDAKTLTRLFLRGFIVPSLIFFLDLPIKVAAERVIKRNRLPFRELDSESGMRGNREFILEVFYEIDKTIPVCHVNANKSAEDVTIEIIQSLKSYFCENDYAQ